MDADKKFTPVPLSAIGRSGTFIIERASENVTENNSSDDFSQGQQELTSVPVTVPSPDTKLKTQAIDSQRNDEEGIQTKGTNEISNRVKFVSNRNDADVPTKDDKTGKDSDELPDVLTKNIEKEHLDQTNANNNAGINNVFSINDETKEPKSEIELPVTDVSKDNVMISSDDVSKSAESVHPDIEPSTTESVDEKPSNKGGEVLTVTQNSSTETVKRQSLDITTINGEIVSTEITTTFENIDAASPDVVANVKPVLQDDSSASTKKQLTDSSSKPDQLVTSEIVTKEPEPVGTRIEKSEPQNGPTLTSKIRTDSIPRDGNPASLEVPSTNSQETPISTTNNGGVSSDEPPELQKNGTSSSQSSERAAVERPDFIPAQGIGTSEELVRDFKPTADQEALTTDVSPKFPGSFPKPTEKQRPTPAPRKSVVKQNEEPTDKYLLLHKKLCDRWESITNAPKFQNFDSQTRALLQEQADRRLMSLCPPNFDNDFKILLNSVEVALKRFYDQENNQTNYVYDDMERNKDLPTLQFFNWILPALDKQTQDLLFDCNILKFKIK